MKTTRSFAALCVLGTFAGCVKYGDEAVGLYPASGGSGPEVKWDVAARPLPEIPFPNDAATFPDPDSPTGRRVNASMVGTTKLETDARKKIDRLDGFGIFAPIYVSFDEPLDLGVIRDAQQGNDDFADDVVYLVNLEKGSPRYGQPAILDVGNGNFPVVLNETEFFENDERAGESNIMFETVDEVALGEDTNNDGVLSVPNVLEPGDDTEREVMTFYERATNTLIVRPLLPLDEKATYAVILTKRLRGEDGQAVRSPFDWINDVRQTPALEPLVEDGLLEGLGLTLEDVAFTWSFTTQSVTGDMVAIRQGMEGYGPFSSLGGRYPAVLSSVDFLKDSPSNQGSMHVLDGALLRNLLRDHGDLLGASGSRLDAMLLNYRFVDYFVAGTFTTPSFITDDGTFHVNPKTGRYEARPATVTWVMVVPKKTAKFRPPFPLQVHIHGYTSSRLELIAWAGSYCRFGSAVVAIDAWGHGGGLIPEDQVAPIEYLLSQYGIRNSSSIFTKGRARDLNRDGFPDNGGDYWTADMFHTRDVVRQTAVDASQLVRIFRTFDGVRRWQFDLNGDGERELAGDFNADGVVDAGGPFSRYRLSGGSLGGILTGVIAATEPYITDAVTVAGAAGLPDVGIRSTQGGVNEAVLLRILGPLLLVRPQGGTPTLAWQVPDVNEDVVVPFAELPEGAQPGDRVDVRNLTNGETRWAILSDGMTMRTGIPADAGDRIEVVVREGSDADAPVRARVTRIDRAMSYQGRTWDEGSRLVSLTEGYGMKRQTPELRRFFNIAGFVTEPGDPIAYARHFFLEPLPILAEGPRAKNVMIIPTIGDSAVPIATGLEMARAAGLLPVTASEARDPDFSYGRPAPWDPALGYQAWATTRKSWDEWRTAAGIDWGPAQIDLAPDPNRVMVENFVAEGMARLRRFEHDARFADPSETLFDVDDFGNGADGWNQPRASEPLRVTRRTSAGISALRIPFMKPEGQHGFGLYEPDEPFDMPTFMHALLGHYMSTDGREVIEDVCLEDMSCEFIQQPDVVPEPVFVPWTPPAAQAP